MDYKKIHKELNSEKRKFAKPAFDKLYKSDPAFAEISKILCKAYLIAKPSNEFYAELERAGVTLSTQFRDSKTVSTKADFGSSSEFSDDLSDEESTEKKHISHIKLRLCSGMKAILLAQYGALSYLKKQDAKNFAQDVQKMYYEVEDALKLVDVDSLQKNSVRNANGSNILMFDLNHCNAANSSDNQTLEDKLNAFKPNIVIVDTTSSTALAIETALKQCFFNDKVKLVFLVSSGLKNDQGGRDCNPYGEVRICGRDRETIKTVSKLMQVGLSENDKLTQASHEQVRIDKRRGFALSLHGHFRTNKLRFRSIPIDATPHKEKTKSM
jgi:hypothetical protein